MNPLFTVVALVSLALGIGANTAIFQLVDAVVLRTLPVRDPPTDLEVLLLAMAGMAVITLLASGLPAERAAAVDPMDTLREE